MIELMKITLLHLITWGQENYRKLCKPEITSQGCKTVSFFQPSSCLIRLYMYIVSSIIGGTCSALDSQTIDVIEMCTTVCKCYIKSDYVMGRKISKYFKIQIFCAKHLIKLLKNFTSKV